MSIEHALADIRAGKPIIVTDHADRENEGDLILAAELATPETIGFMIRYTSGVLCVALTGADCDRLGLPAMVRQNEDPKGTAYTVSVDLREGTTTGIGATERARTIVALACADSSPRDFTRPGHVFPLRAHDGGLHARAGHTEAAVAITTLAGLRPSGVIAEIVDDRGEILRGESLDTFAEQHGLTKITIDELIQSIPAPLSTPASDAATTSAALPTQWGNFTITSVQGQHGDHVAIHSGDLTGQVLVRLHSECLTGDALGSLRCDCGPQLQHALSRIDHEGGLVIYLRGHEGRGIGLANKIRAYALQDHGLDTVDANVELGLPVDAREWSDAIAILHQFDVKQIRLMTNNPAKVKALADAGFDVVREPHQVGEHAHNERYLITKALRLSHTLEMSR